MSDPDYDIRDTLAVVNKARFDEIVGQETLIVCGTAKGMTSFVSYALYNLEFYIGQYLQPVNYEDREFQAAFPKRFSKDEPLAGNEDLAELVNRRNAAYPRWAFKLPRASEYATEFPAIFRNPVTMFCVRNQLASARSIVKRTDSKTDSLARGLEKAQRSLRMLTYLAETSDMPSILIDMDKASKKPAVFLAEICDLLQIDTTKVDTIVEQLSQSDYKRSEPRDGIVFSGPVDLKEIARKAAAS